MSVIETTPQGSRPISKDIIFHALEIIGDKERIRVPHQGRSWLTYALPFAFVGGYIMGPLGILLVFVVAYNLRNTVSPVSEFLLNLPQCKTDQLYRRITASINHLEASNAYIFLDLLAEDESVYRDVFSSFKDFVTSDLKLSIYCDGRSITKI